jgi:poly(3-hydroxybutyrate) depolymerase
MTPGRWPRAGCRMNRRTLSAIAVVVMLLGGATACGAKSPPVADTRMTLGNGYVIVHAPARHDPIGVVVLHSYENEPRELVKQGWSKLADSRRFVAIYPARGSSWNAGLCCGGASAQKRDDVAWLAAVIAAVRARFALKTIFVAGNSNGAMMAERLVAERPDITRRLAVWGGAPEMPRAGRWRGYIAAFDGSKDKTVPAAGGASRFGGKRVIIRPANQIRHWLIGASVHLVRVKGAGHRPVAGWPALAWRELKG